MEQEFINKTDAQGAYLNSLPGEARESAEAELIRIHNGIMQVRAGSEVSFELILDPKSGLEAKARMEIIDQILGSKSIVGNSYLQQRVGERWQETRERGKVLHVKFVADAAITYPEGV